MPDITLEEIQEKFDSLPENLRLAIIVAGADKKVNTIGREHGLNIKQIAELLLRTHVVMFGFVHPDKLEDLVRDITKIPPQVVKGITRDINSQIIKDIKNDLLELAEKPQNVKEVEAFIGESTPGGKSMTPEELTTITPAPEKEISSTAKEDNILKSAGIEIPMLESGNEVSQTIAKADLEIAKEEVKAAAPVKEDKQGEEILKSAGIEIPSLTLSDETEVKTVVPETPKPIEEKVETIETTEITSAPTETIETKTEEKESGEIMKIAFTDLPKEEKSENVYAPVAPVETEIIKPEAPKEITPPPYVAPTKPVEEKPVIEVPVEPVKEVKPLQAVPIPPKIEEPKPIVPETPKPIEEKAVPVEPKPEVKEEPKKEETPQTTEQVQEEVKKSAELKIAVKNIIDKYQSKEKAIPTYTTQEEEKRAIVMQIVEVQDGIKKMKDRLNQLVKERTKLEKDKHALAGKGDTKGSKVVGDALADLDREEKMIQVLRESILPKEYLDLLVRLDKLSANNPPSGEHK